MQDNESGKKSIEDVFTDANKKLRDLIEWMLCQQVTSYSVIASIPTNNSYQSVRLRDEVRPGFRERRAEIFAGFPLRGAHVFEIGCNLGENCRILRELGAEIVDGLEYEKLFVFTGQLINIYNGLDRITLRQGDASNPEEYQVCYDHVVAFSVFPYIKDRLADISRITKKIFLLETHQINEHWVDLYVSEGMRHFRYMSVVCATDWGRELDRRERRLLLAFSNDPEAIPSFIMGRSHALKEARQCVQIDIQNSNWKFLESFKNFIGAERDLKTIIARARSYATSVSISNGTKEFELDSIEYWCNFLVGYDDFLNADNKVEPDNPFIDLNLKFTNSANANQHESRISKARRYFEEFSGLCRGLIHPEDLEPIILYNCSTNASAACDTVREIDGREYYVSSLEGHHCLFSAIFAGIRSIDAVRFWYLEQIRLHGNSEDLELKERLRQFVV